MRLISWNVNGLRARVANDGFLDLCREYSPDFVCLQEIKMFPWQKRFYLGEVYEYWNPSTQKGTSGTAIFAREKAISMVTDMGISMKGDGGRIITLEYAEFYLVTVYVPTGTGGKKAEGLQRKLTWLRAFVGYIQRLNQKKPVILCGDMNIAHEEIDLSYPNSNSIGFTCEERAIVSAILNSGFVDSFRCLHPNDINRYTWVSNKYKTGGLRLDYFFVSEQFKPNITKADILREKAPTDHCPILLELSI